MSATTRIPAAAVTGAKGWTIKRFTKKKLGQVPTAVGVYWHHPQVLMDLASIGRQTPSRRSRTRWSPRCANAALGIVAGVSC